MNAITSLLTGHLWKFATAGAGLLAVLLSVALGVACLQNRDLTAQRLGLAKQINDPTTGYVVRLAQETTNVEQLKTVVKAQNAAYTKLSVESKAKLAEAEASVAAAQAQTRTMQLKLDRFLSTKPQGASLDERVRDIDSRAMSEFVK